jgi:hypothetical protein
MKPVASSCRTAPHRSAFAGFRFPAEVIVAAAHYQGSESIPPGSCWSPPATTPAGCAPKLRSLGSAVPPDPGQLRRTDRHRLHRRGDRDANSALWRVALVRMRCHQPTRNYVDRRITEGKTKTEIMRCLKRYIAYEAFVVLAGKPTAVPSSP